MKNKRQIIADHKKEEDVIFIFHLLPEGVMVFLWILFLSTLIPITRLGIAGLLMAGLFLKWFFVDKVLPIGRFTNTLILIGLAILVLIFF